MTHHNAEAFAALVARARRASRRRVVMTWMHLAAGFGITVAATTFTTLWLIAETEALFHYATIAPLPAPEQTLALSGAYGDSQKLFDRVAGMTVLSSSQGTDQCLYVWPDRDLAPSRAAVSCVGPDLEPSVDIVWDETPSPTDFHEGANAEAADTFAQGTTVRFTLSHGLVEVDVAAPSR